MNIVKHSKDLNSLPLRRKQFRYWIEYVWRILPAILLAVLLGTYLDLYFVGIGAYSFPLRPMPSVFSINIAFPLIGLPLLISVFLNVCEKLNRWGKIIFILFISLIMAVFEKLAETLGLFYHHDLWKHMYSFFGYTIYLTFIFLFYKIIKQSVNDR